MHEEKLECSPLPFISFLVYFFQSKQGSLLLECSLVRCSTLVGSSLGCKYKTQLEKHSSLLQYGNNYDHKKFENKGSSSIYFLRFFSENFLSENGRVVGGRRSAVGGRRSGDVATIQRKMVRCDCVRRSYVINEMRSHLRLDHFICDEWSINLTCMLMLKNVLSIRKVLC